MDVLVLYSGGGALARTKRIDNYPGFPSITGPELLEKMRDHAREMGAVFESRLVRRVMPMGDVLSVLADNDLYEAKAVILAMGTARVRMLPGEEALVGMGVSYCATCDGMFYKDGELIVIGAHEEAVEEANYLATLARVTYVKEKPHETGGLAEGITVLPDKPLKLYEKGEKPGP